MTCVSLFFAAMISAYGQGNDKWVLEKAMIGKTFVFGKWTAAGETETHLKYLGKVKTKSDSVYKIMNSVWVWGLSHRATSRILIFNTRNQYVGDYCVTGIDELPTKLKNGKLIFSNSNNRDCDRNILTIVDFRFGIPKQIFRKCECESGDIYTFESF